MMERWVNAPLDEDDGYWISNRFSVLSQHSDLPPLVLAKLMRSLALNHKASIASRERAVRSASVLGARTSDGAVRAIAVEVAISALSGPEELQVSGSRALSGLAQSGRLTAEQRSIIQKVLPTVTNELAKRQLAEALSGTGG